MKYLIALLFALISSSSFAGRIMLIPPIETMSGWEGGVCSTGTTSIITVRNRGSQPQTIKIRTLEATILIGANDPAIAPPTNWQRVSGAEWKFPFTFPAGGVVPMDPPIVAAGGTAVSYNNFGCEQRKSGVSACGVGAAAFNSNVSEFTGAMVARSYLISGKVFFQIEIDEDEGSVIASVLAKNISSCGGGLNTTVHNVLVNGGRPF